MARPIASVHIDLARLGYEYSKVSVESAESAETLQKARAKWIDDLIACLLLRDPSLSKYGAHLLLEAEEYRRGETERKKAQRGGGDSAESQGIRGIPAQTEQTEQTDRQINTPPISPSGGLGAEFEKARKAYPGPKRGFAPEWKNFEKKFGKRAAEILPLLLPAIARYRAALDKKSRQEGKPALWANLATWLNQERWTMEYPGETATSDEVGRARAMAHHDQHGFYPPGTPPAWMAA